MTDTEWKTIKIPKPLYDKIKYLAEKLHLKIYQVVEQGVYYVDLFKRQPYRKKELPRLDKCAWYVYKLSQSVGIFKENPTEENWNKLMNTVYQIRDRIGVDTSMLEHILERLKPNKKTKLSTEDKIELNDTTKLVIADIMVKMLFEEEKESTEEEF